MNSSSATLRFDASDKVITAPALASPLPPQASRWQASLALRFRQQERGCRLVSNVHKGPLYVQKPFYPEGHDTAHVYLLHPPGGLVSGDSLGIEIQLEENARVLATTPGAGRVYRARDDRCLQQQTQTLRLAAGSVMEWFPQEMIVYPGACGRMNTTVDMDAGSTFMGWDICCLGLPASAQHFDHGEIRQRLFIRCDGRPRLLENLSLDAKSFDLFAAAVGMQSCPVTGVFVAGTANTKTAAPDYAEELVSAMRSRLTETGMLARANITVMNGFIIGRYLGHSTEEARRVFIDLWKLARPVMVGRQSCLPGIWAT